MWKPRFHAGPYRTTQELLSSSFFFASCSRSSSAWLRRGIMHSFRQKPPEKPLKTMG